jgi:SAM-dependent methyltransferase
MCRICQHLFAIGLARADRAQHRLYGERKRRLFEGIRGRVIEIGPGTGGNFRYLPRGIEWAGLEPNPAMHRYLRRAARGAGIAVDVLAAAGEAMPVPDGSADAVVSTLVLCSVADPDRVLREVRRVLRPGGRFYFIEHVAAPHGSMLRKLQRLVRPVWRVLGDGCEPDRETACLIAREFNASAAGFEWFRVPLPVITPHIAGCVTWRP